MNSLIDSLRVSILPIDVVYGDKEANLQAVEQAFESMPAGTDVAVLPELFSTGMPHSVEEARELAETNNADTIYRLKALANKYGTAIAGSFLAKTLPGLYNRGLFLEPNGDETYYDKHHLFSSSREVEILRAGTERLHPIRFRGWNIGMVICYDLRFPAWCRTIRGDYDVLLVPANWPGSRQYAWTHLLIARAIENQAIVVGANRSGEDGFGKYDGLSDIYDFMGKPIGQAVPNSPWMTALLSREKLMEFRRNFPALNDADEIILQQ